MLLALAIVTLLSYVDATGNVAHCPPGCDCQLTSYDSQLYVDCGHRLSHVDTCLLYTSDAADE